MLNRDDSCCFIHHAHDNSTMDIAMHVRIQHLHKPTACSTRVIDAVTLVQIHLTQAFFKFRNIESSSSFVPGKTGSCASLWRRLIVCCTCSTYVSQPGHSSTCASKRMRISGNNVCSR